MSVEINPNQLIDLQLPEANIFIKWLRYRFISLLSKGNNYYAEAGVKFVSTSENWTSNWLYDEYTTATCRIQCIFLLQRSFFWIAGNYLPILSCGSLVELQEDAVDSKSENYELPTFLRRRMEM